MTTTTTELSRQEIALDEEIAEGASLNILMDRLSINTLQSGLLAISEKASTLTKLAERYPSVAFEMRQEATGLRLLHRVLRTELSDRRHRARTEAREANETVKES